MDQFLWMSFISNLKFNPQISAYDWPQCFRMKMHEMVEHLRKWSA